MDKFTGEKMKDIIDFIKKKYNRILVEFKAKTGRDANVALIVFAIVLIIIVFLIIKSILGWVSTSLMG